MSKCDALSCLRAQFLFLFVFACLAGYAQVPSTIADQLTTPERITRSNWWPTDGKAPRGQYVGPQACALCHSSLVKSQLQHSMARASVRAEDSGVLRDTANAQFQLGDDHYDLSRAPNGTLGYTVRKGGATISAPIEWAFGAAKVGQSYLSNQNGVFHEIRFSYFSSLRGFDVTPNQSPTLPTSIDKAAGRMLETAEAGRCFGCHTTASTSSGQFQPANAIPGVSCEACHGPGSQHISAMKADDLNTGRAAIRNPGKLSPIELVDFCGACHTTWWDAKRIGATGVANIRFHPYRLESSRCWGNGDSRLTCISCHNPHEPLVRDESAYDVHCLSCHLSSTSAKPVADHPGSACPVANKNCASCHMPKYEVPDMHYKYTDHKIRIVKAGEPFSD
jgi:nitrate reductase cytochrome c-type subunit